MIILGITGGVGSGKSRVLSELHDKYDAYIIETDKLAHELMEPGGLIYKAIKDVFGDDIIEKEEPYRIDRKKLGAIVFNDKQYLETLNNIVHPLVKTSIIHSIEKAKEEGKISLFVIEAALLIDDPDYKSICDELWYVRVDEEVRIKRLMLQRNYTREKCLSIMQSQSPDTYYQENVDFVIDNNGDYENTSKHIEARLNKLL